VATLALLAMLTWVIYGDLSAHREASIGLETGLSDAQPSLNVPSAGTNVALEQYDADTLQLTLDEVKAIGFGTVRQRFPGARSRRPPAQYDWARWDRIVAAVHDADLDLIAVVDTSPAWARPDNDADDIWAPPADPADYAAFLRALAIRYGGRITAYQIWDQPNIAPYWSAGEIDPAGYVALLKSASQALRAAAPMPPSSRRSGPNTRGRGHQHERRHLPPRDLSPRRRPVFRRPRRLRLGLLDRPGGPPRRRRRAQFLPGHSAAPGDGTPWRR
jgi:hypothetical protein